MFICKIISKKCILCGLCQILNPKLFKFNKNDKNIIFKKIKNKYFKIFKKNKLFFFKKICKKCPANAIKIFYIKNKI